MFTILDLNNEPLKNLLKEKDQGKIKEKGLKRWCVSPKILIMSNLKFVYKSMMVIVEMDFETGYDDFYTLLMCKVDKIARLYC